MNQNYYVTVWEVKDNVYVVCRDDTISELIQHNERRVDLWKRQIAQFNDVPLPTWTHITNYVSHRESKDLLTREEISDFLGGSAE